MLSIKSLFDALHIWITLGSGFMENVTQPAISPSAISSREGANKRGNSSRLTQSFHFFMFEPI
ncbi:hypothetical protein ACOY5O_21410, partial [Enterobacter roggenkampii]|uniref:hypothetical protein n=1 Tax=Enterobacter roggenkampii TaxID=1812935 RepID=UPI003BD90AB2